MGSLRPIHIIAKADVRRVGLTRWKTSFAAREFFVLGLDELESEISAFKHSIQDSLGPRIQVNIRAEVKL